MIRSVLALQAKDDCHAALEDFYREHRVLEISRSFPGCLGATLWRSVDTSRTTHVVIADWQDANAYDQWVADPFRARTSTGLAALLDLEPGEQIIGSLLAPLDPPAPAGGDA